MYGTSQEVYKKRMNQLPKSVIDLVLLVREPKLTSPVGAPFCFLSLNILYCSFVFSL